MPPVPTGTNQGALWQPEEGITQVPSSLENMVDVSPNPLNFSSDMSEKETRSKMQKSEGAFSGDVALVQREEDWMIETNDAEMDNCLKKGEWELEINEVAMEEPKEKPGDPAKAGESERESAKSYKDILKGNRGSAGAGVTQKDKEKAWDGRLYLANEEEMKEGVTITDSVQGPLINFSVEEQTQLAQRWSNSLIVKQLGGNTGYMRL